jgi:hypothetical protein
MKVRISLTKMGKRKTKRTKKQTIKDGKNVGKNEGPKIEIKMESKNVNSEDNNINSEDKNKEVPEDIFDMTLYTDQEILDAVPDLNKLEEMLKGYEQEMEDLMNNDKEWLKNIPEEYRWTEFEECMEEWRNPDLARKMKELREEKEPIEREIAAKIFHELQISKLEQRHKEVKNKIMDELDVVVKRAERLYADLRIAVEEGRIKEDRINEIGIELRFKAEKIEGLQKELESWEEAVKDKNKNIMKLREDNMKLIKETGQLRMTILEIKKGKKDTDHE